MYRLIYFKWGWYLHVCRTPTFFHVPEGRMVVTVWTQWIALSSGSRWPQHQLKVIQGTTQLLVEFDGTVLGEAVGVITVRAVQATWLGLETEHKSPDHLQGQQSLKLVVNSAEFPGWFPKAKPYQPFCFRKALMLTTFKPKFKIENKFILNAPKQVKLKFQVWGKLTWIYFMKRWHLPQRERGLPVAAKGEKDTSISSSIPAKGIITLMLECS